MTHEIICAGFGGQGILFLGKVLAFAGLEKKKKSPGYPLTDRKCEAELATVPLLFQMISRLECLLLQRRI